ncbi:hypothetical protein [Robertmurraya sp. P23]|uniref:hypothetical protein n=1 Tax=Robertmurraya sp. P23 TaxID=3436931 RepID=UPI003D953D8D
MNKLNNIDKFFIIALLVAVFFLRYVKLMFVLWYIPELIVLGYVCYQLVYKKRFLTRFNNLDRYIKIWAIFSLGFLSFIIGLNIYKFGIGVVFFENILMTFMPSIMLVYFIYLATLYSYEILYEVGEKILRFLNIYFWINTPIIILQFFTGTFMMKRFLSWGNYDFDHMTGLIGPFGTGILNVFWVVLLIGNLFFYFMTKRKSWLASFIIQIPVMFVLSYFNENKSIIPTVILFLFIFIGFSILIRGFTMKVALRFGLIISIGLIGCIILYFTVGSFNELVDKMALLAYQLYYGIADPHNERAYLNYLAFNNYDARHLGAGINTVEFNNQDIHPNLGINSMSLLLIHGGKWYLLAVINFYTTLAVLAVKKNFDRNTVIVYFVFLIIFSFLTIITQPFREHYIVAILAFLSLFVFLFYKHQMKENKQINTGVH